MRLQKAKYFIINFLYILYSGLVKNRNLFLKDTKSVNSYGHFFKFKTKTL